MTNNSEMPSKILIVDDEKTLLIWFNIILKKMDLLLRASTNGRDAIKIARSFLPDLIYWTL